MQENKNSRLETLLLRFNTLILAIAGISLISMMLLTCAAIVSRWLGSPLKGSVELMGLLGAVTAAMGLGYAQMKKDFIAVTVLVDLMPPVISRILKSLNDLICMAFSLIAAVFIIKYAMTIQASNEVTETLRIIFHPFIYITGIGFAVLAAAYLVDIILVIKAHTTGKNPHLEDAI
ncbi:TRAP-type C4-dicarboxylate transport system, small permease component [Limihaloglobus sulfuriphilus]|uniref:TRAP-type C4-dicarboxylate transport system, small permease component n=1 Tax=Limihaloglobus sulfuriphilus TaxID=1851148 RepID=A0A1Q2MI90_9BACT|nr:TRAP transporter small permease [Limihaloglobus sulfuriphilus]AQQ72425.1 TRAP-type C4-dicarboxylate transport system, small permease component [Limihaloglobus sulfuriphilus]